MVSLAGGRIIKAHVVGCGATGICFGNYASRPAVGTTRTTCLKDCLAAREERAAPGGIPQALRQLEKDILREATVRSEAEGLDEVEAVRAVYMELASSMENGINPILHQRAQEICDLGERLCQEIEGSAPESVFPTEDSVLVCEQLSVGIALELLEHPVKGVITSVYNPFSHASLLLREAGLPVAYGFEDLSVFYEGRQICIDGREQLVILDAPPNLPVPSPPEFPISATQRIEMRDGTTFTLGINAAGSQEFIPSDAEIGLLRTEFMHADTKYDSLEESLTAELAAVACMHPRTTVRLPDFGGDKTQSGPKSLRANPALGMRGVRVLLSQPALTIIYLRAILKASCLGRIRILVPMVTLPRELNQIRDMLRVCQTQLRAEGVPFDDAIPLGAMIETPAAVICADELAETADFASIGLNDLTQYIMAADRDCDAVHTYFNAGSDAVLRAVRIAMVAFRKRGKEIGVCGEAAAASGMLEKLALLGIREASVPLAIYTEAARDLAALALPGGDVPIDLIQS